VVRDESQRAHVYAAKQSERRTQRQLMGDLEGAGMLAAHASQRRRITRGIGGNLSSWCEPGRNGQGCAVEEVAAGDHGGA